MMWECPKYKLEYQLKPHVNRMKLFVMLQMGIEGNTEDQQYVGRIVCKMVDPKVRAAYIMLRNLRCGLALDKRMDQGVWYNTRTVIQMRNSLIPYIDIEAENDRLALNGKPKLDILLYAEVQLEPIEQPERGLLQLQQMLGTLDVIMDIGELEEEDEDVEDDGMVEIVEGIVENKKQKKPKLKAKAAAKKKTVVRRGRRGKGLGKNDQVEEE